MLEETVVALAAAGGNAVIAAAGTDAWKGLRQAVARWFGRGNTEREQAALKDLDQTADKLHAAKDTSDGDRVHSHWEAVWQTRIEELLKGLGDSDRITAAEELHNLLAKQKAAIRVSANGGGLAVGGNANADNGAVIAGNIGTVTINHPTRGTPQGMLDDEYISTTTIRIVLESVAGLGLAIVSAADGSRHRALDKLFADLETVHGDYLAMFEAILDRVSDAWEEGTPHFGEKVRATASELRRLRLTYEPVRVRLQAVARLFAGVHLPAAERSFAEAVLAYFPTGELRSDDLTQQVRTSGTAVLDHLYRSLDGGELGLELGSFVRDTLQFHRERWSGVCQAHAVLQLSEGWG